MAVAGVVAFSDIVFSLPGERWTGVQREPRRNRRCDQTKPNRAMARHQATASPAVAAGAAAERRLRQDEAEQGDGEAPGDGQPAVVADLRAGEEAAQGLDDGGE